MFITNRVIWVTSANLRVSVQPRDFPFENRHSGDSLEKMWEKSGDLSWEQEERVGKVSVGPTTARVKQFLWHPPEQSCTGKCSFLLQTEKNHLIFFFLTSLSHGNGWGGPQLPVSTLYYHHKNLFVQNKLLCLQCVSCLSSKYVSYMIILKSIHRYSHTHHTKLLLHEWWMYFCKGNAERTGIDAVIVQDFFGSQASREYIADIAW